METGDPSSRLRSIPSVDSVLRAEPTAELLEEYSRATVTRAIRRVLDRVRAEVRAGAEAPAAAEDLHPRIAAALAGGVGRGLRRVINATGVVAHTGLGRSILPPDALAAIAEEARGYCLLAADPESNERATRFRFVEELLTEITGAEAACVVNNNAAATLLVLNTLAEGREVILSRGQMVEIGGSFRIPDVLRQSGARLVEVGCTNKTHLADYESAITERTGLILRVHTSNYRIVGFAEEVSVKELAELGARHGIPVADDQGAGSLLDLRSFGFPEEPLVQASVKAGADVVSMSGDKLIGGPQAGVIVGRREIVDRIHRNPLYRALRVGKLTLVALEATLQYFLDRARTLAEHPTTRMLTLSLEEVDSRAQELCEAIGALDGVRVDVEPGASRAGSGSYPAYDIPTRVVALSGDGLDAAEIALRLRMRPLPVFARVHEGRLLLDPRTLLPGEIEELAVAVRETMEAEA